MYNHEKCIDDFKAAIQKNSAAISEDMTQRIMIAFNIVFKYVLMSMGTNYN